MGSVLKNTIAFIPIVEQVSRKFALRRETCSWKVVSAAGSTASGNDLVIQPTIYMGSGCRNVNVLGYGAVKQNYFFMRKKPAVDLAHIGSPTADTMAVRLKFATCSKWVAAAMKDLTAITFNQQVFLTCKNDLSKGSAGVSVAGFTSMRNWMFAVASALYGDYDNPQTLPDTHKVPAAA